MDKPHWRAALSTLPLIASTQNAMDKLEKERRIKLADYQQGAWPALNNLTTLSKVTAVCSIVVDTLGRIYRTAESSGSYRKRCFSEWTGPLTFPQAYAYACTLLEGCTNLSLSDMDILALSAPQLVMVDDYPVLPHRPGRRAAFNERGNDPIIVWVQVFVLDPTQLKLRNHDSLLRSHTSTRPAFPGKCGLFSFGRRGNAKYIG